MIDVETVKIGELSLFLQPQRARRECIGQLYTSTTYEKTCTLNSRSDYAILLD